MLDDQETVLSYILAHGSHTDRNRMDRMPQPLPLCSSGSDAFALGSFLPCTFLASLLYSDASTAHQSIPVTHTANLNFVINPVVLTCICFPKLTAMTVSSLMKG